MYMLARRGLRPQPGNDQAMFTALSEDPTDPNASGRRRSLVRTRRWCSRPRRSRRWWQRWLASVISFETIFDDRPRPCSVASAGVSGARDGFDAPPTHGVAHVGWHEGRSKSWRAKAARRTPRSPRFSASAVPGTTADRGLRPGAVKLHEMIRRPSASPARRQLDLPPAADIGAPPATPQPSASPGPFCARATRRCAAPRATGPNRSWSEALDVGNRASQATGLHRDPQAPDHPGKPDGAPCPSSGRSRAPCTRPLIRSRSHLPTPSTELSRVRHGFVHADRASATMASASRRSPVTAAFCASVADASVIRNPSPHQWGRVPCAVRLRQREHMGEWPQ